MDYIKRSLIIIVSMIFLGVCVAYPVWADDPKPELSEQQTNAIMQNCSGIRQSLAKLQHADSRTRTYLGSAYEAIAGRFITPLNLRLVKNGLPSSELFRIQNEFTTSQAAFRTGYVDYMREMDTLVATDCASNPRGFYDQLKVVRERRETLREVTKRLATLAEEQYKTVAELKDTL